MNKIDIYTKLFADSFRNDPGIKLQLAGITNPEEAFNANCRGEIEAFDKLGMISNIEEDGMIIGYTPEDVQREEFMEALQQAPKYLLQTVSEEDLLKMQNNIMELSKMIQPDWYNKFLDDVPVYILHVVMVRQEMRGKGLLRKLFTPVFERCERENRTIVLQTHSDRSASIYRHFGFEVMEELHSEKLKISCYNMMKRL